MPSKTAKKRKPKRKSKAKTKPKRRRPDRPTSVDYLEVKGGRRTQAGEATALFVRIEERSGVRSVSLGSGFDKLQIRVSADALRKVMAKVDG